LTGWRPDVVNDALTVALASFCCFAEAVPVHKTQQKTQDYIRRHWPNLQVAALGIATGITLFFGVRALSPHPGQSCGELGQVREEWELGMPAQQLMCVATLDGDLRYGRMIMPSPKKHSEQ
jgi:hypothetical protein